MSVPSPCTSVCRISPASGWCEGCSRTLEEIAAWGAMSDAAKMAVWRALPLRSGSAVPGGAVPAQGAGPMPPVGGSYPR